MPRSFEELMAHADQWADQFEAYEPADGDDAAPIPPLIAVKLAAYRRAHAERELFEAVRSARAAAVTWRELGEALGTSGEAARQRYAGA